MTDFDETARTPVRAATKPKGDRSTQILLILGALVAVAGLAFAGGRFTAPAAAAANNSNNGLPGRNGFGAGRSFTPGQIGRTGGGGLNGGVEGTVESVNGTTMTVRLASGTSVTVDLAPTTTYHNETAATSGDVKAGSQILVTIDPTAFGAGTQPGTQPGGGAGARASGAPGAGGFQNRTFTAKDVIIVAP